MTVIQIIQILPNPPLSWALWRKGQGWLYQMLKISPKHLLIMNFLWGSAMTLLHSGIVALVIVQAQHLTHLSPNDSANGFNRTKGWLSQEKK